jgi:hypothetical protein
METISSNKFDENGREILVGDTLEAQFFNGEQYKAILKVVIDPRDNEICLQMISGNKKAMENFNDKSPYQAFPSENEKGWLRKGVIINR